MWGTGFLKRMCSSLYRFIPTHVGNGPLRNPPACRSAVHPHACGERRSANYSGAVSAGSSPRMWGTALHDCCVQCVQRFIPTHVGNGPFASAVSAAAAVHPHACGERTSNCATATGCAGSSPRMWGTGLGKGFKLLGQRFIPTHVGNGGMVRDEIAIQTVHPHACGERVGQVRTGQADGGSSPRMWGTGVTARAVAT